MSWIISSINIPTFNFYKRENYFYYTNNKTNVNNIFTLIEGDFYYNEHLFCKNHSSCLDVIDGSYAIALFYDNYVLCACDCICTRNIFYFQNKNIYLVSSSLKLILDALVNCTNVELNRNFLNTYLVYGNNHFLTPYKGVRKLPQGFCIKITDKINIYPYVDFDYELKNAKHKTEYVNKADYSIDILKSHCNAIAEKNKDKTVLTEISGGVDSSLLTGLLYEISKDKGINLNGYSYTYKNQFIGNELIYMKDVARKNNINNHIITDLDFSSFKIADNYTLVFPDMSILNGGLLKKTHDAVLSSDVIVSGQGGDICIGDYYNIFINKGNILAQAYMDSLYYEKFILTTLKSKIIYPLIFKNIISWKNFDSQPCYPLWMTDVIRHNANRTLNNTYRFICKFTKNLGMRKSLIDYLDYNGLISDDIFPYICFYPYLTRDMVIMGQIFNENYFVDETYRYKIKHAARKYFPLSVYLRKGKSRMDTVFNKTFLLNYEEYKGLIMESEILETLLIDKKMVLNEINKIISGEKCDVNFSLRIVSMLVWYKRICNKYPTVNFHTKE